VLAERTWQVLAAGVACMVWARMVVSGLGMVRHHGPLVGASWRYSVSDGVGGVSYLTATVSVVFSLNSRAVCVPA
jgi:hypothetical protein